MLSSKQQKNESRKHRKELIDSSREQYRQLSEKREGRIRKRDSTDREKLNQERHRNSRDKYRRTYCRHVLFYGRWRGGPLVKRKEFEEIMNPNWLLRWPDLKEWYHSDGYSELMWSLVDDRSGDK